jgi:hypothetical protein
MELYFPIDFNKEALKWIRFKDWSNTDHRNHSLKCVLSLPDFMVLFNSNPEPPIPQMPFSNLAHFRDREQNQTIEILIQASVIQSEVTLLDYYGYWAQKSKEELIQTRFVDNNTDKPDMLLSKRFSNGQTWITRRTGYKVWMGHGAYVVTLSIACDLTYYAQNADLFFFIITSFRPSYTPDYNLAERLTLFSRRYPVDFATYVPMSWEEVHHHNDTMQEMKSCLTKTYKKQISGVLTVNTATLRQYPTTETILWPYLNAYFNKGFDFNAIKTREANVFGRFHTVADSINFTYRLGAESMEYNLTFYLGNDTDHWFYVEMFGPSKVQDFDAWAINKRALQLFIENFKTV